MLKGPVLEYNRRHEKRFVGLYLFFFGMLFASMPIIGVKGANTYMASIYLIIGLPTLLAGAYFAFAYDHVLIDRRVDEVIHTKGFYLPLWRKKYDFKSFIRLEVSSEVTDGSDAIEYFYARLIFQGETQEPLNIAQWESYESARMETEKMARFLELPIKDYTRSTLGETSFAELNLTLAERSQKEQIGELATLPALLPTLPQSLVLVHEDLDKAELTVAAVRLSMHTKVSLGVVSFFWFVIIIYLVFHHFFSGGVSSVMVMIGALLALIPIPTLLSTINRIHTREHIFVEKGKMVIERSSLIGKARQEIDVTEIRDIAIHSSCLSEDDGKVMVIGNGEVISVGELIAPEERHSLCTLLKRLIIDAQS